MTNTIEYRFDRATEHTVIGRTPLIKIIDYPQSLDGMKGQIIRRRPHPQYPMTDLLIVRYGKSYALMEVFHVTSEVKEVCAYASDQQMVREALDDFMVSTASRVSEQKGVVS